MNKYEELKNLVAQLEEDFNKFNNGNMSAGTRVRKQLQGIKKCCQEFRQWVQEKKKAG